MNAFKEELRSVIEERSSQLMKELFEQLKDRLKKEPPSSWQSKYLGKTPTDADIERLFNEEVQPEIDRLNIDFNPSITLVYKDITYQTFKDKKFRKLLGKRFGKDAIDTIFGEYDAAPEQKPSVSD